MDRQKAAYIRCVNDTSPTRAAIIADFKENFRVGSSPVETNRDYYSKRQVSLLTFAIIYGDESGKKQVKYVDYFSDVLNHDSLFAGRCLIQLMSSEFMQQFQSVALWSDCGPHFRSKEYLNYALIETPRLIYTKFNRNIDININYFVEYHGKSIVDSHFGVLMLWLRQAEALVELRTKENLQRIFFAKYNESEHDYTMDINAYKPSKTRLKVRKLIVSQIWTYLSFVFVNGQLFGGAVSTFQPAEYQSLRFKLQEFDDHREDKYAPGDSCS